MYHVREARGTDIVELTDKSRQVLAESIYSSLLFDPAKTANYIMGAILKQPGWFIRVIVDDADLVVGGLICCCSESIFGPDKIAQDITIMVLQEHRGRCTRQLLRIVREYKEWAIADGAKLIKMGVSSGMNMDKTSALFEHMGFKRIGAMHGIVVGG